MWQGREQRVAGRSAMEAGGGGRLNVRVQGENGVRARGWVFIVKGEDDDNSMSHRTFTSTDK